MIIEKEDITLDVSSYSLKLLKYFIPSPPLLHSLVSVDGRDADIITESFYKNRVISAEFMYNSQDLKDFYLLKSEIYRLFATKEPFYIIFKREPGKRWKVRLNNPFDIDKFNIFVGSFTLEFLAELPFAESVGTTLDPFTFDAELWQFGQGIIADDLIYTHSTNTFSIFNGSDVMVDPRQLPLKIEFKGASNNLTIRNTSTGDEWKHNGSTVDGDIVLLDGIEVNKNGQSIFGQTNLQCISLLPGWNEFELAGAEEPFTITFDFRFYTL